MYSKPFDKLINFKIIEAFKWGGLTSFCCITRLEVTYQRIFCGVLSNFSPIIYVPNCMLVRGLVGQT